MLLNKLCLYLPNNVRSGSNHPTMAEQGQYTPNNGGGCVLALIRHCGCVLALIRHCWVCIGLDPPLLGVYWP